MLFASSAMFIGFHQWPSAGQIFDKSVEIFIPHRVRDGPVRTLSWSMDGQKLVTVSCGKVAEVLDVSTEEPRQLHVIKDYGPICAEFVNKSDQFVLLGTTSKQVLVYDVKRKQVKEKFKVPTPIKQVGCTAKDTHIVAALSNGEIRVYNNRTKKLSQKYAILGSKNLTRLKCHSSKDNFIIAGSAKGIVALYDLNVNDAVYVDAAHAAEVTNIVFSPSACDGLAISSGRDGTLVYHDVCSMTRFAEVKVDNAITAMDFSADGMSLVTGSETGEILIFDLRNRQKPVYRFRAYEREITNLLMQKQNRTEIVETCSFLEYCKPEVREPVEPPTLDVTAESSLGAQSSDTDSFCDMCSLKKVLASIQTKEVPLHKLPAKANAINQAMLSFHQNARVTGEDPKKMSKGLYLQKLGIVTGYLKADKDVETMLKALEAVDVMGYEFEKLAVESNKLIEELTALTKIFSEIAKD